MCKFTNVRVSSQRKHYRATVRKKLPLPLGHLPERVTVPRFWVRPVVVHRVLEHSIGVVLNNRVLLPDRFRFATFSVGVRRGYKVVTASNIFVLLPTSAVVPLLSPLTSARARVAAFNHRCDVAATTRRRLPTSAVVALSPLTSAREGSRVKLSLRYRCVIAALSLRYRCVIAATSRRRLSLRHRGGIAAMAGTPTVGRCAIAAGAHPRVVTCISVLPEHERGVTGEQIPLLPAFQLHFQMSRRRIIVDDSDDDALLGVPSSSSVLSPAALAVGTFPPVNGAGNLSCIVHR